MGKFLLKSRNFLSENEVALFIDPLGRRKDFPFDLFILPG
jgi:hypothetical protein